MIHTPTVAAPEGAWRPIHAGQLRQQLGGNLAAISGGRMTPVRDNGGKGNLVGLRLPVHAEYRVDVLLAADDTYTVRRIFSRSGVDHVKGERTGVYADEVGQVAYEASCYVNIDFPAAS